MLFLLGFRRLRTAKPGPVAALGRLIFAVLVAFFVGLVALGVHLDFAGARVAPGNLYRTDGSTPVVVHGAWQNTTCNVGEALAFTAPAREETGEFAEQRGYHLPADGARKEIVCAHSAEFVESELVRLSWLLEADWVVYLAGLIAAAGFVAGWSTGLVRRRSAIPG